MLQNNPAAEDPADISDVHRLSRREQPAPNHSRDRQQVLGGALQNAGGDRVAKLGRLIHNS